MAGEICELNGQIRHWRMCLLQSKRIHLFHSSVVGHLCRYKSALFPKVFRDGVWGVCEVRERQKHGDRQEIRLRVVYVFSAFQPLITGC